MMKWLKWSALALLIFVVASTLAIGFVYEKHFDDAHQRFADQYDLDYSKPRNNRGLFTSDLEVCFRPRHGVLASGASFCAAYQVQYGPVLWHGGLNLGWLSARVTPRWPAESQQLLATVFGKEPPLQIALQARFDQTLYVQVKTPKIEHDDATAKFSMQPLLWHNWIDLKNGHYRSEAVWPALRAEAPVKVEMDQLTFDGDFRLDSSKLWLGQANFAIKNISVNNSGVNIFQLNDAHYRINSENNSNSALSDHRVDLTWQRMQIAQQMPTNGDVKLSLTGVSKAAMQQLQTVSQALSSDLSHSGALDAVQQLLAAGLRLNIEKLDISTDAVHARGKGEFVLPASDAPDAMMTALNRIEGKVNWSLPLGLVNQWFGHETLQQWLGEKRIWLEGNLVHFALTMQNGEMHLGLWRVPLPGSEPAPMPADFEQQLLDQSNAETSLGEANYDGISDEDNI
jgi:hypothetical protein